MKELRFRYTNHEWYSLVRSFLILIGMILVASVIDIVLLALPVNWLSAVGTVVRSVGLVIGLSVGAYLGFRTSRKLFDKEGTVTLADDKITIKLGKKEREFDITDIEEITRDTFAKFDGLRFKDTKSFGPLFTKHSIVTEKGEFSVMSSIAEGWEKTGLGKDNPIPIYSLDDAFESVRRHFDRVRSAGNGEINN